MRPHPFRLQAITRRGRHDALRAVGQAIREAGGGITDFHQFSHFAIVLELEIAADRLASLRAAIEAEGLLLGPSADESPVPAGGDEEVTGTLRIEFVQDEPDH
jgi:hypothetical protein